MNSEKLAPAIRTDTTVCHPNTTVSSTVTTKRNQQVYTQQIITSRVRKVNQSPSDGDIASNQTSLVPLHDSTTSSVVDGNVKRTTKTYCRRIIRKIGPNGEVSEEIIEEGDAMPSNMFPASQLALENTCSDRSVAAIGGADSSLVGGHDDFTKKIIPGAAKFQARAGFNSVSETGEQRSMEMSTGPLEFQFNNASKPMLSIENSNKFRDEADAGNQLATISNPGTAMQQIMPDGTIVTRTFYGEKTATGTDDLFIYLLLL